MSNADYRVQDAVKQACKQFVVPDVCTVVGTGAFGSWVAIYLAKAGIGRIKLINPTGDDGGDPEDVGGREIAVGPFYDRHLGVPKVDALEEILGEMRPDLLVEKHKIIFDPLANSDLLEGCVFAGVSNADVLFGIFEEAKKRGLRCFGGSYNANLAGCYTEFPQNFRVAKNAPVWVGSAAISALLAVNSAFVHALNYYGDLSELDTTSNKLAEIMRAGSGSDI